MATNYNNMTENMKKLAAALAAQKAAATPKPASILGNTPIGNQMAATAAKNVGVTLPKPLSVAASASAKAQAAEAAAYASRSADLQRAAAQAAAKATAAKPVASPASILANTSIGNQMANTAAKAVGAPIVHIPTLMETAIANSKASTAALSAKTYGLAGISAPTTTNLKSALAENPMFNPLSGAPTSDNQITAGTSAKMLQDNKAAVDTNAWLNNPGVNDLRNSLTPAPMQNETLNTLVNANQPQTTQVQNPMDILAATPIGQQMQNDAARNVAAANTPAASSPSGGGSSSGSGSGGNGYTAGSTADMLAPVVADIGATATDTSAIEIPAKAENPYFNALLDMKFEYNPATDQGYLQAAAQAENAIIQSIIGRGGLYSSVAQSAVATKLSDLGIEYEKMAYTKYTDQRTYLMQLANFEQDRIDTEWEQNYKIQQSSIDFEQQRFENQLALANFQFAQEKEAFDQGQTLAAAARASASSYSSGQASSAKAATAASEASIAAQLQSNQLAKNQLAMYTSQWAKDGTANKAVASFFSAYGVQFGSSMSDYEDVITAMGDKLNNEAYQISQAAIASGEGKIASQYLDDYMKPVVAVKSGSSSDTSTSSQSAYYYQTLNQLTGKNETSSSTAKLITNLTSSKYRPGYESKMGTYYFSKLLDALNAQKLSLQKSEKSTSASSVFQ